MSTDRSEKDTAPKLMHPNSFVSPVTAKGMSNMSKEEEEIAQQRRRDELVVDMLQHSCGHGEV